jgi:two-component SAPR family response regulator
MALKLTYLQILLRHYTIFKAKFYDVAISDVRMPGMSLLELCKQLTKIVDKIRIIFVSAFVTYASILKVQFPNIDHKHFIDKPISTDKHMSIILEHNKVLHAIKFT